MLIDIKAKQGIYLESAQDNVLFLVLEAIFEHPNSKRHPLTSVVKHVAYLPVWCKIKSATQST